MEKSASPDPARKVVTRSPKRNVGLVSCPWFQSQAIEHESRLEKHFVLRAMLSPIVKAIAHQPFELSLGGKERYIPDFMLSFKNGQRVVVEVKRAERIKALKERLDRIAARLAEDGLTFFVVHQGQIEGASRAERAALLRRYAMLQVDRQMLDAAVRLVRSKPSGISIGAVMRRCQFIRTPSLPRHRTASHRARAEALAQPRRPCLPTFSGDHRCPSSVWKLVWLCGVAAAPLSSFGSWMATRFSSRISEHTMFRR